MEQATITTQQIYASPDGRGVEVVATLNGGKIAPGMFLCIPMNRMLDFTVRIRQLTRLTPPYLHLVLECDDEEDAQLILAFHFNEETLQVTEDGSD